VVPPIHSADWEKTSSVLVVRLACCCWCRQTLLADANASVNSDAPHWNETAGASQNCASQGSWRGGAAADARTPPETRGPHQHLALTVSGHLNICSVRRQLARDKQRASQRPGRQSALNIIAIGTML
jgi:hypothetical protein